jgi:competence CoiA-like predicted nuclease
MQMSIVNNKRVEAFAGGRGVCPSCGSDMIAKCGPNIFHHWALYWSSHTGHFTFAFSRKESRGVLLFVSG